MVRVLIAEDSATVRILLREIFAAEPKFQVVGFAGDGLEAVEMTRRLRPDVVTMDIRMPRLDGFAATQRIMAETPTPIVILSAHVDDREVDVSMRALALGALAVLAKPEGPGAPGFDASCRQIHSTVLAMSQVKVVTRRQDSGRDSAPQARPDAAASWTRQSAAARTAAARTAAARVVAIAASTGGPPAMHRLLAALPARFDVPILLVQHIGTGFTGGLVRWLDSVVPQRVKLAEDGETAVAGTVYVAPDDQHLELTTRNRLALSTAPPRSRFRPSGDVLFESVARVHGASAIAVILTGMGRDGVEGLREVRQRGGLVIAQDEASSVVFGMPGEAVAAGLADEVLNLEAIAAHLAQLTAGS